MKLFPTDEEYGDVAHKNPLPQLALIGDSVEKAFSAHASLMFGELTVTEWFIHLANRMIDARQSFHLMLYFFQLGIPDDPPWISPGKGGVSVEYFPKFVDADHSKLAWFSFYADAFAFKLFSAWDSIGQLLAVVHGLNVSRPSFFSVAESLEKAGVPLGKQLLAIRDRDDFVRFSVFRHDTTHNFLPGTFGGSVQFHHHPKGTKLADGTPVAATKSYSFGVGKYVKASDVVAITRGALEAFEETLRIAGLRAK